MSKTPAEIAAELDDADREYFEAVAMHECGPATDSEMLSSDRLIAARLIYDVDDPEGTAAQLLTPLGRAVARELPRLAQKPQP